MAVIDWAGGNGSFSDPNQWIGTIVPSTGDVADMSAGGTVSGSGDIEELEFDPPGQPITGSSLTLTGNVVTQFVAIEQSSNLTVASGATLTATHDTATDDQIALAVISASIDVNGGTALATGQMVVSSGTITAENNAVIAAGAPGQPLSQGIDGLFFTTATGTFQATTLSLGSFSVATSSSVLLEQGSTAMASNGLVGGGSGISTATVTGQDTEWTNQGVLTVGFGATGTLTVSDDAMIAADATLFVGRAVGSGSSAVNGDGTVELFTGATATSGAGVIGIAAQDTGDVVVDGMDSVWTVGGTLLVGDGGDGSIDVADSGQLTVNGGATIGAEQGGDGTAMIESGGSLDVGGSLVVGDAGAGSLQIDTGAIATVDGPVGVGGSVGGNGTLTLADSGTMLTVTGDDVTIGDAGSGTVLVTSGALFDAGTNDVTVGDTAGAHGSLTITDDGSGLSAASLTVGDGGSGTLDVADSGRLILSGDATIGDQDGSDGSAIIENDASLDVGGGLTVGDTGTGTLAVNDADATVAGDDVTVGGESTGSGTFTLNASTLDFTGTVTVGDSGNGLMIVQGGASIDPDAIKIGDQSGATGDLEVSGAGSQAQSSDLTVGGDGQGMLGISGGGLLITVGDATIGDAVVGVVQSATLDTQGTWTLAGGLTVGGKGIATASVQGAGAIIAQGDVTLGDEVSAGATMTVSGTLTQGDVTTPSRLAFGGHLVVGNSGTATLNVTDGAVVAGTTWGSGTIELGASVGGSGTVLVDGLGSALQGSILAVGGTDLAAASDGLLTISDQALVSIGDAIIWNGGSVVMSGGTLSADPLTLAAGGAIDGDGVISGAISDLGTITALGGTLALTGDVSGGGTLAIAAGAELDLDGTVAASLRAAFQGAGGTLYLAQPASFAASIADLVAGETIALAMTNATTAMISGSTLEVALAGGGQLDYALAGAAPGLRVSVQQVGSTADLLTVPCFAAGTRIATARGEVAVETLRVGDRVVTLLGEAAAEIIWIGQRNLDCTRHPKPREVWPVRVAAGAFGPGRPHTDLLLSPDHAIYVADVLIPVKHLINGSTIAQVKVGRINYHHLELPAHNVLLAEGLPAESFLDLKDGSNYANRPGPIRRYPDFTARMWEAFGCARLVVTGPELAAARARLRRLADRQAA